MKKELLSIMFLLGVSIALINITPEINQIDSAAPHLKENKDINLGIKENKKFENSATPVTFDIIRISQDGDTVMEESLPDGKRNEDNDIDMVC